MFLPHIQNRLASVPDRVPGSVPDSVPVPVSPAAVITQREPEPEPTVLICDDCKRKQNLPESFPSMPVRVLVCCCDGTGAALQYSPNGCRPWYSDSYHETAEAAASAFLELSSAYGKDTEPDHYRIKVSADCIQPEQGQGESVFP